MPRIPGLRRYFRLPSAERDVHGAVDDEIAFHVEMLTEQLVADGLSATDARDEALHRFGNLDGVRRRCYEISLSHDTAMRRHEMLVVSGNRAQFWGTGTLNGVTARFRITAIDGNASGHGNGADAIRVELWDASGVTVLYDTQPGAAQDAEVTTPTEGGNIRIRAG